MLQVHISPPTLRARWWCHLLLETSFEAQSFPRRRESILLEPMFPTTSKMDSRLRGNDCAWSVQTTPPRRAATLTNERQPAISLLRPQVGGRAWRRRSVSETTFRHALAFCPALRLIVPSPPAPLPKGGEGSSFCATESSKHEAESANYATESSNHTDESSTVVSPRPLWGERPGVRGASKNECETTPALRFLSERDFCRS